MKRFLRENRKIIIVVCIILIFTVVYFTSWINKNREREKAVIENGKLIVLTRYTESNTTSNQSTVLNAYLIENIHSSGFSKSFISRFQMPFTQPPGWCWEGEGQGYKWHNINELYRNNWQFLNYAKYGCWTFRFSFDESEKQLKTGKAEEVKFSNPTDILNMHSWKGQYNFFFKSHHCLYPLANDYQYEYNQFLHSFTDYIRK
ncbi:MAG: hypothetical protein LWY06_05040, partial [Firmicutes bacterium]|nr:hypothetical protein [Bacillota bacterium]